MPGIFAGPRSSLCSVLKLIQERGPPLGLHINISKCEVFSCKGLSSFPPVVSQQVVLQVVQKTGLLFSPMHQMSPPLVEHTSNPVRSRWDHYMCAFPPLSASLACYTCNHTRFGQNIYYFYLAKEYNCTGESRIFIPGQSYGSMSEISGNGLSVFR